MGIGMLVEQYELYAMVLVCGGRSGCIDGG